MPIPAILRNVPLAISTNNLTLRCPREGDGQVVFEAVLESLDELRRWPASLPWTLLEPSIEQSEAFCRSAHGQFIHRTALTYLVFNDKGKLLASVGLHAVHWEVPKFELGFWCRSSCQRQGIASEAAQALVQLAIQDLHAKRVEARPDEHNLASRKVCERIGMQLEGILRSDCITPKGEPRNTCIYSRIAL